MVRFAVVLGIFLAASFVDGHFECKYKKKKQVPHHRHRYLQNIPNYEHTEPSTQVCRDVGVSAGIDAAAMAILSTMPFAPQVIEGLQQYAEEGISIGSTTELIPEANDANAVMTPTVREGESPDPPKFEETSSRIFLEDGKSGDTSFPYGNLKPIATVGERSVCPESYGQKLAGPTDGLGAYLVSDEVLRVMIQSEAYGPLLHESYPIPVNDGTVFYGGSHIHYVDYLREDFATFMDTEFPASEMVTGTGQMIQYVVNLKGEYVGPRNGSSATTVGAHFTNTDADGKYTVLRQPAEADWFIQSLCSASLDIHEQWGPGIGLVDDVFMTNEEWINYGIGEDFVGLSAHALDVATKTLYAVGAFTNGGFEKNVEINPKSPDHVMYAISGYNGNLETRIRDTEETFTPTWVIDKRTAFYGNRTDGKPWVWTKDTNPMRIYVGVKGLLEDGTPAPEDDFLARNGLKYGQIYGFSIDMTNTTERAGPTAGLFRDEWHKTAMNGEMVTGKWLPQPWRWNGTVTNFEHDGSWDYQEPPIGAAEGEEFEGYFWWSSAGPDKSGCKTEHIAADPRVGVTGFVQTSTCGYFGHNYVYGVEEALAGVGADLPSSFDGEYFVYQGETDVVDQIELGGAGMYSEGRDARFNWDSSGIENGGKRTFEDIDGVMLFEGPDEELHVIIQEDSGSKLGDRMVISSALEHDADDKNLTYYFVAMSGGEENSKEMAGVGIPRGVMCYDGEKFLSGPHEFSGVIDVSGFLVKNDDGSFMMSAGDPGTVKREGDRMVAINDKYIIVSLQAHSHYCGIIGAFQANEGGQWLLYQPNIPVNEEIAVGRDGDGI